MKVSRECWPNADLTFPFKWFDHPRILSILRCTNDRHILAKYCQWFGLTCSCIDSANECCQLCSDILLTEPPVVALNGTDKIQVLEVLDWDLDFFNDF